MTQAPRCGVWVWCVGVVGVCVWVDEFPRYQDVCLGAWPILTETSDIAYSLCFIHHLLWPNTQGSRSRASQCVKPSITNGFQQTRPLGSRRPQTSSALRIDQAKVWQNLLGLKCDTKVECKAWVPSTMSVHDVAASVRVKLWETRQKVRIKFC